MKALTALPEGYMFCGSIDLSKEKTVQVLLTVASVPLLIVSGLLFLTIAHSLAPGAFPQDSKVVFGFTDILLGLGATFLAVLVMVTLHEVVHGIFFWFFSLKMPHFGWNWLYAYAYMPGIYLPRLPYIVVGLAPLVVLTCIGVALLPILPPSFVWLTIVALTFNATGAVGDLYVVLRLLLAPRSILIQDQGSSMTWYKPASG